MAQIRIPEVDVNLWNKYKVRFSPHPDVNIIVGINGSGKTTMLSEIDKDLSKRKVNRYSYIYVPSVDNLIPRDKRKKESAITQELNFYIYDIKDGPSLFSYRISTLDALPYFKSIVDERVKTFCNLVDSLFKDTGKKVKLENNTFSIITKDGKITPSDLSSGEKQILLLLLRVFLLNENESVVLIDEPENSLDISWQYKLIDILTRLNPNAQFFITTHSPSIFGNGWGDKIIYMEDVTTKIEKDV
ncbi:MAG: ATP-binding protein [Muribaculaceae bacterium]|nr:ATP-binding protein [Muribaculaceae bacterium]